jgi:hypothetical protein
MVSEKEKIIWDKAASATQEHYRLREKDLELQIEQMRKQIDDLKRKAEQGSQQIQGETQELELEKVLSEYVRNDDFSPVDVGARGADVLQGVRNSVGQKCGAILWESKRAKQFGKEWLQKAKEDQMNLGADWVVIVTATLPKGIVRFGLLDGVWICELSCVVGLAMALRTIVLQVAVTRSAETGKSEKKETLYRYWLGPGIKQLHTIAQIGVDMETDLKGEKRSHERMFRKRGRQLQRIVEYVAVTCGDLEGIMDGALPAAPVFEIPEGFPESNMDEAPDSEEPETDDEEVPF